MIVCLVIGKKLRKGSNPVNSTDAFDYLMMSVSDL